jgi:hypothetical protein
LMFSSLGLTLPFSCLACLPLYQRMSTSSPSSTEKLMKSSSSIQRYDSRLSPILGPTFGRLRSSPFSPPLADLITWSRSSSLLPSYPSSFVRPSTARLLPAVSSGRRNGIPSPNEKGTQGKESGKETNGGVLWRRTVAAVVALKGQIGRMGSQTMATIVEPQKGWLQQ